MNLEKMRCLKSQLKRKVSITKGLLILFMITGSLVSYSKDYNAYIRCREEYARNIRPGDRYTMDDPCARYLVDLGDLNNPSIINDLTGGTGSTPSTGNSNSNNDDSTTHRGVGGAGSTTGASTTIDNKANKDGSNIDVPKFTEKLNEGVNISTPTNKLVKDSDVKTYLDNNYINNTTLTSKLDDKSNKDLSNLSENDKEKARTNLDVYKKSEVDGKLDNKANIDGSNINTNNYIEKLSNSASLDNPTNKLVTDTIVKEKLDIKLNKDLSNLDESGKDALRTTLGLYKKDEVNSKLDDKSNKDLSNLSEQDKELARTNLDVYKKSDVDSKLEEKAKKDLSNLNEDEKELARTNLDVYKKLDIDNKLDTKANKNADNIEVDKYISKLNDGANISTPTDKLVKDRDIKTYLDTNYTTTVDLTNKLDAKANKDASNIDKKAYIDKLIENSNLDNPNNALVTDTIVKEKLDIKVNKDLSNLNEDEKSTLRTNLDIYKKLDVDNKLDTKLNKLGDNLDENSRETFRSNLDLYKKSEVDSKLDSKVNKDLSNLSEKDKEKVRESLNVYTKEVVDTKLNSDLSNLDESGKNIFRDNLDVYKKSDVDNKLDGKASIDGSNINEAKYIEKLSNSSNLETPTNKLVTDSIVKDYLTNNYYNKEDMVNKFGEIINNNLLQGNIGDNNTTNSYLVTDRQVKDYVDKENSKYNAMSNAGIANAVAIASLPQVNHKYLFGISAASGYYNKAGAIAVGVSGQIPNGRFMYKVNSAIDTNKNFSVGVGATVSLGEIHKDTVNTQTIVKEIKTIDNSKEVKELRERNSNLETKLETMEKLLNQLSQQYDKLNNDIKEKENNITEKVELKEVATPVVKNINKIDIVNLDKYEFNSVKISDTNKTKLNDVITNGYDKVEIDGHTDKIGSNKYNMKLSLIRASEVRKYLLENGYRGEIEIKGFGKTQPKSNIDAENRRVEIVIK